MQPRIAFSNQARIITPSQPSPEGQMERTMEAAKHTALPWSEGTRGPNNMPVIGARGLMIAHVTTGIGFQAEADANAAFIVKAVNSHEQLIESVKALLSCMSLAGWDDDFVAHQARAAIAAAGAV